MVQGTTTAAFVPDGSEKQCRVAVTLTGDGERAHLRHAGIDLHTHVADVVGLVQAEELQQTVLVGHSYGGMVITGAADRLLQASPQAVRALVYVDAMVPLPGEEVVHRGRSHGPEPQAGPCSSGASPPATPHPH